MSAPLLVSQLDEAALARLDALAARSGRSRDAIASAAITAFVEEELDLLESLDAAEAQIDRGEYLTQEQMEAWFEERSAARRLD